MAQRRLAGSPARPGRQRPQLAVPLAMVLVAAGIVAVLLSSGPARDAGPQVEPSTPGSASLHGTCWTRVKVALTSRVGSCWPASAGRLASPRGHSRTAPATTASANTPTATSIARWRPAAASKGLVLLARCGQSDGQGAASTGRPAEADDLALEGRLQLDRAAGVGGGDLLAVAHIQRYVGDGAVPEDQISWLQLASGDLTADADLGSAGVR